jgi:3-hydroxyacyl-CoA dehydrogenase/3a,7a,12a-trihydroxy-5b-cholest-24-enoyl-CoA hydratase
MCSPQRIGRLRTAAAAEKAGVMVVDAGRMLSFEGRVAVVTGAGSGLGRAHARLLAARGCAVVVNDVGASVTGEGSASAPAEAVAAEIVAAGGRGTANADTVERGEKIVECALDHFGRVDIVVNNAGILRDRSFSRMTWEDWRQVMAVHLDGAVRVTQAAWPHMRAQGYGRVVVTSSAAGLFGNFGQANYGAAKMGLVGLCRTLAIEGAGSGIAVNAVSPSAASRMSATIAEEAAMAGLQPEQVSALVAFLCHESCEATGRIFAAGGGWCGELRLQQASGARLPEASPEEVAGRFAEICEFAGATAPAGLAEALAPVLAPYPALRALLEPRR